VAADGPDAGLDQAEFAHLVTNDSQAGIRARRAHRLINDEAAGEGDDIWASTRAVRPGLARIRRMIAAVRRRPGLTVSP
jgi:hypothetical protein